MKDAPQHQLLGKWKSKAQLDTTSLPWEWNEWNVSHSVCLTLSDPMDCSPAGSSVHAIFQARILECVTIPFSRGPSRPRDHTWVSCIASRFFTMWATREAQSMRIAVIKKKKKKSIITIESFGKDVEKLEPDVHCWQKCKMVQPLWKTMWWFLKNIITIWSNNSTWVYTQENWKQGLKRHLYINVVVALLTTVKGWKKPKCPWQMNG